jgi:CRISPR-associated RAMP protein (TIGR02581 family)
MLKRLVNEARFILAIETTGPVLVKAGHASLDGRDMEPVRTFRNGSWQVYLPGSSLKGVVRSHLEKVVRSLSATPGVVCNPFLLLRSAKMRREGDALYCDSYPDVFCGDKFEIRKRTSYDACGRRWQRSAQDLDTATAYADSCSVCRIFGSTSFVGRVSISDAYLTTASDVREEFRDGVGIDRLTGGAAHGAKFDLAAVPSGVRFEAGVVLRNFECWQLGALLLIVQDLADGLIRVGSGRSRGFGGVRGWIVGDSSQHDGSGPLGLEIHYFGSSEPPDSSKVVGLGKFLTGDSYGTRPDDELAVASEAEPRRRGVRYVTTYTGGALEQLTRAAIAAFVQRIQDWQVPPGMTWESLRWQPVHGGAP